MKFKTLYRTLPVFGLGLAGMAFALPACAGAQAAQTDTADIENTNPLSRDRGGRGLGQIDSDGDGSINHDEFTAFMSKRFESADKDGDGALSGHEFRGLMRAGRDRRGDSARRGGDQDRRQRGGRNFAGGRGGRGDRGGRDSDRGYGRGGDSRRGKEFSHGQRGRDGRGGHGGRDSAWSHGRDDRRGQGGRDSAWGHGRDNRGDESSRGRTPRAQHPEDRSRGRQGGFGRGGERPDPSAIFKRFDTDGDGRLTLEEAPPPMAERFEHLDANSDGAVDLEEMKQAHERMRKHRAEGRGGGRPGEGRRGRRGPEGDKPEPSGAPAEAEPEMNSDE